MIQPESKMIDLCGKMIVPQFGEYNIIYELDSKPNFILYWVRDYTAIFKKEITLLINSKQLKVNEISRIDIIVGGDHGQGNFRFLMKLLFVVKNTKNIERTSSIAYILCKKDNGGILKNTIIDKHQRSFMLMFDIIKIDNHQVFIDNLCVISNLACLVILLGN